MDSGDIEKGDNRGNMDSGDIEKGDNHLSSITTMSNSRPRINSQNLEKLPDTVLTDILSRVAKDSILDLFNLKFSCKSINSAAEDDDVYKWCNLEKFELNTWNQMLGTELVFLGKCKLAGNYDMRCREALELFFIRWKDISPSEAIEKIENGVSAGHHLSMYVKVVLLMAPGDIEMNNQSVAVMDQLARYKRHLVTARRHFLQLMRSFWVSNRVFRNRAIFMCLDEMHWLLQPQWPDPDYAVLNAGNIYLMT